MSASLGVFGQLGIDTANPVTKRFNYRDEELTRKDQVYNGNGLRGTRSESIEPMRDGIQHLDGPINLIPTAVEWALLFQWILGGTPTGASPTTYPLGETAQTRFVTVDRVIKVYTYDGVVVDRCTFAAAKGGLLTCSLDCVGISETTGNVGSFPVLSLDLTTGPFVFTDLALSVNGTTVKANTFRLTVNNHIDRERFLNSLNLTVGNALDRDVEFETLIPFGDYQAIHAAMTGGTPGIAVTATFTNGSKILTMTMPAVSLPKRTPGTPGRAEIMLRLAGEAKKSGSTESLVITL